MTPSRRAGELAGALVCLRDVTEQRTAERATRDAEERFRLAFDHAPIGIALVAPDGSWLRVNDRRRRARAGLSS